MEAPLRICFVSLPGTFQLRRDIPVGKVINIVPHFEGAISPVVNHVIDHTWSRQPINYTLMVADSLGTDGCQGFIARNQSDLMLGPVDFPVKEEYEKVNPIVTLMEEPLVILQAYNKTRHNEQLADVVKQSFQSFTVSLWMAIFCFVLVMGTMFVIRREVLQNQMDGEEEDGPSFFYAFVCFVQQDSKDFFDITRNILTLILSVASFVFITGYFCNLMATDMVVVDKPDVMNTYKDILDRVGVTAVFFQQLADYEHFRDANKDSIEYMLWKVMTTERSNEFQTILRHTAIIPTGMAMLHGRAVIIVSKMFEDVIRGAGCSAKSAAGDFRNLFTYSAVQPGSPKYAKGIIYRQANTPVLQMSAKRLKAAVETGIRVTITRDLEKAGTFDYGWGVSKMKVDDLRQCMSPTLIVEAPGYQSARLGNFKSLEYFALATFFISVYVFFYEIFWFYWV